MVPLVLLYVLEAFEMETEYKRELLDPHTLLCLLIALAHVTEEFIVRIQCFQRTAGKRHHIASPLSPDVGQQGQRSQA